VYVVVVLALRLEPFATLWARGLLAVGGAVHDGVDRQTQHKEKKLSLFVLPDPFLVQNKVMGLVTRHRHV
jgi:hypothetical protein